MPRITGMAPPDQVRSAAFFDLDKTVIAKSISFAFTRKFYEEGLLQRVHLMRAGYAQFVYLLSGASHDQMEQARRYAADLVRGWDVAHVRRIVAESLRDVVDPIVYDEALELFAQHRSEGRDIIIISSSGSEVVGPVGNLLGADVSIGTRMEIVDGHYTGEVEFYAYADNKVTAMKALAAERGYDLGSSYGYTDSYTDLPMLEAVGNPVATNPDAPLRRLAVERGWEVVDFTRPEGAGGGFPRPFPPVAAAVALGAVAAVAAAWYAAGRNGQSPPMPQ